MPSKTPLRTVVALALDTIHKDSGYRPPTQHPTNNTHSKVVAALNTNPSPKLDDDYWQVADEVIDFFRNLPSLPEYQSILQRQDGPAFHTCSEAAKHDDIEPLTFTYAVLMPHLYGKIKPKEPKKLNPNTSEAKIVQPGEFMGKINDPDRFFVKLVYVGAPDKTRGNLFGVEDRNGNKGFWYAKAELFANDVQLSDCFAIHATPTRHNAATNGEKHTIFRNVTIVEKKGTSPNLVPKENDCTPTHLFTKNYVF